MSSSKIFECNDVPSLIRRVERFVCLLLGQVTNDDATREKHSSRVVLSDNVHYKYLLLYTSPGSLSFVALVGLFH